MLLKVGVEGRCCEWWTVLMMDGVEKNSAGQSGVGISGNVKTPKIMLDVDEVRPFAGWWL